MTALISSLAWKRQHFQETGLILLFITTCCYIAFEIDLFVSEATSPALDDIIELDEALLIGTLLCICLLIVAVRRFFDQKRETTRRIAAEHYARELAYQDQLTGLANRRQFDEALQTALASPPSADATHALLLLDLNGFKKINDSHGRGIGDLVLVFTAQRLLKAVKDDDLVARLGGDEFAILSRHISGSEAASGLALRILQSFTAPIIAGTLQQLVETGIGIVLLPQDAKSAPEALRKADIALYRAKAERRSAFRFFEEEMDASIRERSRLEAALRMAVGLARLTPLFRPTVELDSGRVTGFEITLSWNDPVFGEVPPERFLPIAEETGLIHQIMEQALDMGCRAALDWPDDVMLSIAIHASQLKDRDLSTRILKLLKKTGLPCHRLEVEVTESAVVQDLASAKSSLKTLGAAGIKIALGQFGTGYSNLYHLRSFKVDKIKIDRRFVASMGSEAESASIVNALVGLGRGLGLTVGAEGIETPADRAALIANGCIVGAFSEAGPMLLAETAKLLQQAGRQTP